MVVFEEARWMLMTVVVREALCVCAGGAKVLLGRSLSM